MLRRDAKENRKTLTEFNCSRSFGLVTESYKDEGDVDPGGGGGTHKFFGWGCGLISEVRGRFTQGVNPRSTIRGTTTVSYCNITVTPPVPFEC